VRILTFALALLVTGPASAQGPEGGRIEPQAGTWKTWVITSGAQRRVPPPPDRAGTEKELDELLRIGTTRDREGSIASPIGTRARRPIAGARLRLPSISKSERPGRSPFAIWR